MEEPLYFQEARASGKIVVSDPPKLDLDAYISNYKGRTRIERLYHMGTTSSYLSADALRAAVVEAKQGKDVEMYKQCVKTFYEIHPNDPGAVMDEAWIERVTTEVRLETQRLEKELKGYKNNLIKESIRMGQDDLGRHYYETGDLHEASKAYSKEREYCQMPSHLAIMQQRLIMVALEQRAWPNALANIMKLNGINQQPRDKEKIQPKLDAALGICHLQTKRYKDAANTFLQISPRLISAKSKSPTADELYNEVITPNDIAIYGGLCALASMDRDELRHSVLESSSFRDYLELEPQIRRAISSFVAGKYSVCLGILDSYKTDYLLDIHLHRHVQELFSSIQSKAILQYFIPFSCVTIKALAEAFNSDEDRLENDLVGLIKLGILDARIDLERRVLLANRVDPRLKVHEEAMEMAKEYEKAAKLQIIRLELLNAGLEVSKSKQRDQPQGLKSARG